MQFSSPTAGMQAYGAGNGFTWQPQRSNADARASAYGKASSYLQSALDNQAAVGMQASNAATQLGVEEMRMASNERMMKMQADAAAKARKASSGNSFLNTALGVGSLIPGVGSAIGAIGKLFS
jgi:hypothetical protein